MSIHDMALTAAIVVGVIAAIALIGILDTALERWLAAKPSRRRHDANVNPNPAPAGPPPVVQTKPSQPPTHLRPPGTPPPPPIAVQGITLYGGPLDGHRLQLSLPMTMVRMPCDSATSRGFLYADYRRNSDGRFVFDGYGGPRFDPDRQGGERA